MTQWWKNEGARRCIRCYTREDVVKILPFPVYCDRSLCEHHFEGATYWDEKQRDIEELSKDIQD